MAWTVGGVVRRWAAEEGERPALSFEDATQSWADLHASAAQLANGMTAEGVTKQDRVAILDKNTPAHFHLLFGAAMINAVYVSVNWRLAPPEMAQIVNDAEAKVLVVGAAFLPQLEAIEDQLTTVRKILVTGGAHPKHESLEAWMSGQSPTDPGVEAADGDVAMQLYTSGTTGLPKGVMLTNANLGTAVPSFGPELEFTSASVSLVAMPLFHIGGSGWALAGMSHGGHSILLREVDPAAILRLISQYQITHAFLVPAVLMFMLAVPGVEEADFSTFEYMLYGASPISEDVLTRCLQVMGCKFVQVYGLTETTGAVTILRADQHDPTGPNAGRLRSCGVANPFVTIRIAGAEDGSEVPIGTVGEIWIRSAQNMLGYWHQPAETERTLVGDGWLRTGDAGYLDADGFLYLHDRIKDMIVSGGENIYPAEVENALMSHPAVVDAAVIGVPDERWGETVKAIVVRRADAEPTATELMQYCRTRLAGFKCPTSIDFVAALPRNPSGKILKRESARAVLGRARAASQLTPLGGAGPSTRASLIQQEIRALSVCSQVAVFHCRHEAISPSHNHACLCGPRRRPGDHRRLQLGWQQDRRGRRRRRWRAHLRVRHRRQRHGLCQLPEESRVHAVVPVHPAPDHPPHHRCQRQLHAPARWLR